MVLSKKNVTKSYEKLLNLVAELLCEPKYHDCCWVLGKNAKKQIVESSNIQAQCYLFRKELRTMSLRLHQCPKSAPDVFSLLETLVCLLCH